MSDVETVIAARDVAVAAVTTTAANVDLATQQAERAEVARDAAAAPTAAQIATVDADAASAFRVQQDARLTTTFVREGAAFADLGKQTGVDNTGTTECAAALQTALDGFLALGVRAYAKGTFKIASTVTIAGNADLGDATFNYTGTSGTAVRVGTSTSGAAVQWITVNLPEIIAVAKTVTGWAQVAGTVGVELANLYDSTIYSTHIQNFETNLRLYGKAKGCVYNDVFVGHLDNGKVNLQLDADATGWANENTFYGGRYSHDSGEGSNVAGTRHIKTAVTPNPIDNNLWIKPSIEGDTPEFHASIGGVANTIVQGRWEAATPKVRWDSNAAGNEIRGGYNSGSIVETWVAGAAPNDLFGHLRNYLTRSGGPKGAFVIENTSSANDPGLVGMTPGSRVAGTDPSTGYSWHIGPNFLRGKRTADANPRIQIDFNNGRVYFSNGTAAPAGYMYGSGNNTIGINGAHLFFENDNLYDIGLTSLRPRDLKLGRNATIGGALDHDGTTVGFYGTTPVTKPTALTAVNAGTLNTGDATSDTIIANMRTRIGELEAKLQALGLIT